MIYLFYVLILCIVCVYHSKEWSMMKKRLQITMQEDVAKQLEKFAEKMGVSKSVIITLALQEYMNEK